MKRVGKKVYYLALRGQLRIMGFDSGAICRVDC